MFSDIVLFDDTIPGWQQALQDGMKGSSEQSSDRRIALGAMITLIDAAES
jgi:hypothetical protein